MVKNTSGGNKTKKLKRNFGRFNALEKIESGQMFAKIIHRQSSRDNGLKTTRSLV